MKFRKERKESVSVNLTPLIDIVFLLLIFFMVSTSFTRETQLQVTLPEADAEPAENQAESITLVVDSGGAYALNGTLLATSDKASLQEGLRQVAEGDFDQSLVILADANATHQSVVTAMDAAGQLGFVNLRISTQEPVAEDQE